MGAAGRRPKRALVIGASGLVGAALLRVLRARGADATGTRLSAAVDGLLPLDIRDPTAVRELIAEIQPEAVYCPAARPNVDWCERHPEESREVNVVGIRHVAEACAEAGARMVHFSSDYIFDGRDGPYAEEDEPNPVNVYGRHKLEAEESVRAILPERHLVVRTTVVYGWERRGKNFVARLLRALGSGERLPAPVDQVGSPTYAPNLAEAVVELVERGVSGTWHVVGPELMSRCDFARLAAEIFGLDRDLIEPVPTRDLNQIARRPLRAGMKVAKAAAVLSTRLLPPAEGLRRMAAERGMKLEGVAG